MDASKLFEGIALLIDLAQRGEIDPWDVQVIEVIDRYLSELFLGQQAATKAACEADLSQSGQAFLSASMLVLFKANTLVELEQSEADPDPSEDDPTEAADGAGVGARLPLERQLRRRPAALPPQKRRVTLQELIEQLQLMATQLQLRDEANALKTKTHSTRDTRLQSRAQTARVIAELAHQENLTEVAGELEQFLTRHSHRTLDREQDWLSLEQLVELWTQTKRAGVASSTHEGNKAVEFSDSEIDGQANPDPSSPRFLPPEHNDRVSIFWALLLLSAQSKVELAQEEFYQEIKIRSLLAE